MKRGLFIAIVCAVFAQPGGVRVKAQTAPGSLTFFKAYFGNIDHTVGGVGLAGLGDASGLATGIIHINGVTPNADIASAFLYWVSMETSATPAGANGKFRNNDIVGKQIAPANVPSCWGSGGGSATGNTLLRVYRADVLRYLPTSTAPATLGKVLVNDSDLGGAGHEVKLPDSGGGGSQSPSSGNQAIRTEGAALLVVYRDRTALPFKAEVIYDGGETVNVDHQVFDLTLKGFYQALGGSGAPGGGRISFLVADGDVTKQELLTVQGRSSVVNPFQSTAGLAWDNPTYDLAMTADQPSVQTTVAPLGTAIDCLSFAAIALSTPVRDSDGDGIPDVLEAATTTSPVLDPNNLAMPALGEMGADPNVPDIFFEFGYLTAPAGLTYGNPGFTFLPPPVTTTSAHSHLPTKAALDLAAKAFKNAGITPHFDVGNNYQPASYPAAATCSNPTTWIPDCAIVRLTSPVTGATLAAGGRTEPETACGAGGATNCQFKYFPGTVGWKSGFQYFRDERFGFDPRRLNLFHYVLGAHALGLPRDFCLNSDGTPNLTCQGNEFSGFHAPRTNSGMGDVEGGDILLTTSAFGNNFVGQDPVVAGTLAHEAGHNLGRRHSGVDALPNCKPNYLSVMNYFYQFGLTGSDGPEISFSNQVLNTLDQNSLTDSRLVDASGATPLPNYPPRWYAPKLSSFLANHSTGLDIAPVAKHCDGTSALGEPDTVRVEGVAGSDPVDWNNDGILQTVPAFSQDVNFNGGATPLGDGPIAGSNDAVPMKAYGLQQLGSRPNRGVLSLDVALNDLNESDPGRGDPGRGDPGRGDPGRGDPGRGDPGRGDPGRGDPGRGDPGAPPGDLDLTTAAAAGGGPHTLKGTQVSSKILTLTWRPPLAVPEDRAVQMYLVYRVDGATVTPAVFAKKTFVGQATSPSLSLDDTKIVKGKTYTWWVLAQFDNGARTGVSNFVTKTIQ